MAEVWTLFYRDLWGPVWPNLAASVVWTLPAFAWHHRRMRRHVAAELRRNATIERQFEEGSQ